MSYSLLNDSAKLAQIQAEWNDACLMAIDLLAEESIFTWCLAQDMINPLIRFHINIMRNDSLDYIEPELLAANDLAGHIIVNHFDKGIWLAKCNNEADYDRAMTFDSGLYMVRVG